jgi:hypothetical protein
MRSSADPLRSGVDPPSARRRRFLEDRTPIV